MKDFQKRLKKWPIIMLIGLLAIMPVLQIKAVERQEVRVQDDFYEAINKEWLDKARIKTGHALTSTLSDMSDQVTVDLQTIFNKLLECKGMTPKGSVQKKMVTLYHTILNRIERNKQGIQPIQKYLDKVRAIHTPKELIAVLGEKEMSVFNNLIGFDVTVDAKNSKGYVLEISSSELSLGDADEYTMPTKESKLRKEVTRMYYQKLLKLSGYEEETAKMKVENIFNFEERLAPSLIGTKEASTHDNLYEAIYNVYTLKELEQLAPNINMGELMKARGYHKAHKIILQEPKWLKQLSALCEQENLEMIKDYLEVGLLDKASSYLDDRFKEVAKDYKKEVYGIEGDIPEEEIAFKLVNSVFSSELGKLYIKEHFTKEDKKEVEKLTKAIIDQYKLRINALEWMSEETKKQAIEKLETMTIKIGYPNKWENYKEPQIKSYAEGGSLLENMIGIQDYLHQKELKKINKPVDKLEFAMPTQTVNACYVPTNNDITFPAGILQAPLYDRTQSKEANLGAIGAVIGHEISHAFDNNGARFDKEGNLRDWWTKEDYARFEEKTKKVRAFYNQIELFPGEKVNGDLTVGENIADIGAIACMLDLLEDMPNPNYKAFFEAWATTWRILATPEYEVQALRTDVHSPHKVRVNAVLQQFEVFYQTYGITEKDGMYIKPEDRLEIW